MATDTSKPSQYRSKRLFPQRVDECLIPLLKPAVKARGFAEARVLTDWAAIVGPQLAAHTRPLAVRGQAGGQRVLQVAVAPAYATQLHYAHPMILERIAIYFGARAIHALQVVALPPNVSPPSHRAKAPAMPTIPSLAPRPTAAPAAAPIPLPAMDLTDPVAAALHDLAKALQERRQLR